MHSLHLLARVYRRIGFVRNRGGDSVKIKSLGANRTELHTQSGAVVFFSYETPVAAQLPGGGFVRTSKRYSVTTSKHITQWLEGRTAREVSPEELSALAS